MIERDRELQKERVMFHSYVKVQYSIIRITNNFNFDSIVITIIKIYHYYTNLPSVR